MPDPRTPTNVRRQRKPIPFTPDEIVARFEAGEARLDLTKRYRVRVAEIDAALATAGYEPPPRTSLRGQERPEWHLPERELVELYEAGESENGLAKRYGCSRGVIRRYLHSSGIVIRGRGAAMTQRHADMTIEERQALAEAAHDTVRGRTVPEEEMVKRAQTIGGAPNLWTSPYELELDEMLRARGLEAKLQHPVGRYLVDLAFEPLAVEVHRYTGHPMKYVEQPPRVDYLAERGWATLYVWLRLEDSITDPAVDLVVRQIAEYRRDPAGFGKVRTIRARPRFAVMA